MTKIDSYEDRYPGLPLKEIDIYDGEYTIIMRENGTIKEIRRYGKPWIDKNIDAAYQHSGFVLALVQEIDDHRIEIAELREHLRYTEGRQEVEGVW